MSICRYCGQKASWFSEAHESCVQKSNQGIEALKTCVADAIVLGGKAYEDAEAYCRTDAALRVNVWCPMAYDFS